MSAVPQGLNVDRALDYLSFVENRHLVWLRRQEGYPAPWTDDPILRVKKFTNVFRILDPGTQFALRELCDGEPRDVLMRLFLYRHTGRIEAWEFLQLMNGAWPTVDDLPQVLEWWREYRGKLKGTREAGRRDYERPLFTGAYRANVEQEFQGTRDYERPLFTGSYQINDQRGQRPLFTSAYLVYPQSSEPGTEKIDRIIDLTLRLFHPSSPTDVVPGFLAATDQVERFKILETQRGVGAFMSMQVLTDWGYTEHCDEDRENEFVIAGPGAVKGAAAIWPGQDARAVIDWATEAIHSSPNPPEISGRLPSLMDVQNTLCEFSKYVRFQGQALSAKPYKPAHPGKQEPPVLPRHW